MKIIDTLSRLAELNELIIEEVKMCIQYTVHCQYLYIYYWSGEIAFVSWKFIMLHVKILVYSGSIFFWAISWSPLYLKVDIPNLKIGKRTYSLLL